MVFRAIGAIALLYTSFIQQLAVRYSVRYLEALFSQDNS